jgi:hypothetical protein
MVNSRATDVASAADQAEPKTKEGLINGDLVYYISNTVIRLAPEREKYDA